MIIFIFYNTFNIKNSIINVAFICIKSILFLILFFSDDLSEESNCENDIEVINNYNEREVAAKYLTKPDSFRQVPGPNDISQNLDEGPTQHKLKKYPKTIYGVGQTKRMRGFNSNWYELYKWLEYSKIEDSAFCFPCRFFSNKIKTNLDTNYRTIGYKNWKNAMSAKGFPLHDKSDEHKQCLISWVEYKKNKNKNTSVLSQISDQHERLVMENRRYMKAIIISLRMLAVQGQALRGHIENEQSFNRGNFIEVMSAISNFDDVVKTKMNGPKNARYLHHSIQNEIVHIMSTMILSKISKEIKESVYFAVMADETKDVSKTEQLSIVVRYFFQGEIKERFLGFTPLKHLNANSLFLHIKEVLSKCQIDINNCVAQTYDGASVMRGHINGVQAIFKNEVPQAIYTHCANHRLNLVIVDVAKNIEEADLFFTLLQELYVFFSSSVVHSKFIELQKEVLNTKKPVELKRLCLTRWSSQVYCCKAIRSTLTIVLLLLNKLSFSTNKERSLEAEGLLRKIDFKFVYLLLVFDDILSQIQILSKVNTYKMLRLIWLIVLY